VPVDIDWTSYLRVHSDRRNLVIHVFAVPLFVGAFLSLIFCLIRGDYLTAVFAMFGAFAALLLQGRGHALEAHPPEPFSGPGNFLRRWFREQFLVFPMFLLTGRWWHQFRESGGGSDGAA
jgi:hypothetical protein